MHMLSTGTVCRSTGCAVATAWSRRRGHYSVCHHRSVRDEAQQATVARRRCQRPDDRRQLRQGQDGGVSVSGFSDS